jgi:hypothetical protein
MPSRAEVRGSIETALRALSLGLLAWMLWLSLDHGKKESVVSSKTAGLSAALSDWTRSGIAPDNISVSFDAVPTSQQRDWLAALRVSGSKVSWNGSLPAVGVDIEPIASPTHGYNIRVSAPSGSSVVIGDAIGPIDTVRAELGGARLGVVSASGIVTATSAGTVARAILPDTLRIRRVLVLGDADWESKFVTAALEEDGWKVDAQAHVAPGVSVTQGSISPIDTSRYAAIVALDRSAAAYASQIVRYVASGGGVLIAAPAATVDGLSVLRAGVPGKIEVASSLETEPGAVTLQSLSLMPVTGIRSDAVVLDRRGSSVTAAARRYVAGRVMQLGYVDTWRWRMSGGESSVEDHRKFWTNAVAGVAYTPIVLSELQATVDNAPVARLVGALGPESGAARSSLAQTTGSVSFWWLFAILSLSLLAEWISRRSRGAR